MKNRGRRVGSLPSDSADADPPSAAALAQLAHVLDALAEGVLVHDHRGTLVHCNTAAQRMLDLTVAQIADREPLPPELSLIHEDGTPFDADVYPFRVALRTHQAQHGIVVGLRRGDRLQWIAVNAVSFAIAAGRPSGVLSTFRDVSESKRAEAREHDARVRLELAARSGDVGFWDWDLITHQVVYSNEWKRQLGYEPHEIGAAHAEWESRLHPDDRARAVARIEDYLAGRADDYAVEFRLRRKDGTYRWIFARGEAIRDAAGVPRRVLGSHMDVTERHEAQAALVKQKEELVLAMELANLGRWEVDSTTRHIVLDDAMFTLLRTTAEAQGGHSMPLEEYVRRFMTDDARDQMAEALNEALAAEGAEQTRQIEHGWRRADGTMATVTVRFVLVKAPDGQIAKGYGVIQDITDRKDIENRLRRLVEGESILAALSQRFIEMDLHEFDGEVSNALATLSGFIGAVRAAVFLYSSDGRVLNPYEWCLNRSDSLQEDVKDLKTGDLGHFHRELKALRTVQVRTRDDLPSGSVEREWVNLHGFRPLLLLPLTSRAHLIGVLALYGAPETAWTFDDAVLPIVSSFAVSLSSALARKTADEERVHLERQLVQAQKIEAIGTLAGGIAHDFNNILTSIVGNLELARMEKDNAEGLEESLSAISLAADRATALVKQILAFSRHHQHERHVVSMPVIAAEAVRFMRATIPAGIAIDLTIGEHVPPVTADATQMHQILINLCANAWHAMESSPGRIDIRVERVVLDEREALHIGGIQAGEAVCVTVRDTGAGMDEATLKRVFEPFFTTKPVGKGTGLGMSVVHGIVQTHRGGIAIDSTVGQGTSVRVYIKAARRPLDEVVAQRSDPVSGGGVRLLFVDDELALARVMSLALDRLGYRVTTLTDARQAAALFRADADAFDLVVADYDMPNMNGLELARELLVVRSDIPVVMWSGRFTPEVTLVARQLGVRRMVTKPCDASQLSRVLRDVLGDTLGNAFGDDRPQPGVRLPG